MKCRIQITTIGLLFFWGSVGLLVVGGWQFSGVALLLGLSGGIGLGLARVLAVRNVMRPGLRLIREWPQTGFSGEAFEGGLVVESGGSARFNVVVQDRMAALEAEPQNFGRVMGRIERGGACIVRGRGVVRSGEVEVRSNFPLGCWSVSSLRCFDESDEMILWPRPLLPSAVEAALERAVDQGIEASGSNDTTSGASLDLHGLRSFQSGDSVRAIHWPASSRGQGLMVRENERPINRPSRFGLVVHSFAPPGEVLQPDRFEQSLRLACGIICWCEERGIELVIDWLIETPEAPPLTRLALAARREVSIEELERAAEAAASRCDLVWVVGDRALSCELAEDRVCWIDAEASVS